MVRPNQDEILEAKSFSNGWIYRIDPKYDPKDYVPPEAIIGAWQVNEKGEIIGEFKFNPNYVKSINN